MSSDKLNALAIENFREYLRIPSVQPNVNYDDCVAFIKKQAKSLNLPVRVFESIPGKPVVIITWEGLEPENLSILLNGHMDVVPVYPDQWTYPPFSAHMDEKEDIYGRGSQDMKSVSIQYIEAIRRLKLNGIRLKRTIHISFVPDEEIAGDHGMKSFVKSKDFQHLNVGFALDEGTAYPIEPILLFYGERSKWDVWIFCPGQPGHGSVMYDNTSGEKLYKVIDRFMRFRDSEKKKLMDPKMKPGDVTSVNLTMVQGGVQINVIPQELSVGFDVRVATDVDHTEFENLIKSWCNEAGEGVYYTISSHDPCVENTKLDDTNPFWLAFKKACDDSDVKLEPIICPGGTDARHVRNLGIPAFGFTPSNNTPALLHDNNERLNKHVFLKGIDIYMKVIPAVANNIIKTLVAFDIRIPPDVDHQEFENKIKKWCEECGEGVHYTFINKDPPIQNTKLDSSNTFWLAFKQEIDYCGLELDPQIQTGVTDARFLRSIGIPALGFSPMINTPSRAHDHDEFLNKDVFLRGIEIFTKIITAVANV